MPPAHCSDPTGLRVKSMLIIRHRCTVLIPPGTPHLSVHRSVDCLPWSHGAYTEQVYDSTHTTAMNSSRSQLARDAFTSQRVLHLSSSNVQLWKFGQVKTAPPKFPFKLPALHISHLPALSSEQRHALPVLNDAN